MSQPINSQNTNDGASGDNDQTNGNKDIQKQTAAPIANRDEPPPNGKQTPACCCRKKRKFNIGNAIELFVGCALVGVGALQFCVYTRQAHIMDQQTQISVAQFNLGTFLERPWVSLEAVQPIGMLKYDNDGVHITLSYQLGNVGHTPAFDTQFVASATPIWSQLSSGEQFALTSSMTEAERKEAPLIPPNIKGQPIIDAQSRLLTACTQAFAKYEDVEKRHITNRAEQGQATASAVGDVIFPGDRPVTKEFRVVGADTNWTIERPPQAARSYFILLATCVHYKDNVAAKIRYTYSAYSLFGKDSTDSGSLTLPITPNEIGNLGARLQNQYAQ